jgi:branched-chain amino acid transport system permease protein
MMGVEVNRILALTFFISSALAGVAGLAFGLYYGQINFYSGYGVGLRAFTAAVLGGIGSPLGSIVGGLVIGLIEAIGGQWIGVQWTQLVVFALLIITLVLMPTGLFGRQARRRA